MLHRPPLDPIPITPSQILLITIQTHTPTLTPKTTATTLPSQKFFTLPLSDTEIRKVF